MPCNVGQATKMSAPHGPPPHRSSHVSFCLAPPTAACTM
jgi:hypothetical protein